MIDDIRHLRAFLAAARIGNFTRAAQQLHISQSAFTVQIRQLEQSVGAKLFDRSKRRVSLTEVGRDLLGPMERLVIDAEAIVGRTQQLTDLKRGVVRISALPSVAAQMLPMIVHKFAQAYPGVVVQVKDVVAEKLIEMVKKEEVDFGIGTQMRRDRDVVASPLLVDRLCAFVPRGLPLAQKSSTTLKELVILPLILTGKDSSVREIVERALKQQRLSLTLAYETNYMATAISMARAGLGIAVLPECAGASYEDLGIVEISKPALSRTIAILHKKDCSFSPAAAQMVEMIKMALTTRVKGRSPGVK
ncbi:MAG TPA: LysR family transcriptional regulator [Terracidiphilus sp.]|nr:LysR family transcriptional regulator [Terracidiphilus sp.]